MKKNTLTQKIEIAFWNQAIPLMSESKAVQFCIQQGYVALRQSGKMSWVPAVLLASASLGLGMGYILGLMGAIVR
ncbi:MAG TPA: hypothetical protein VHO48_02355 [Anaerolineaceae bacterium]|nr:hypothetical protein [Anaerolineaceae bacterium]